jgi:hypothetical protein
MGNKIMSDVLRSNNVALSPCVVGKCSTEVFAHQMFVFWKVAVLKEEMRCTWNILDVSNFDTVSVLKGFSM